MVPANYSTTRSALAKTIRLGCQRAGRHLNRLILQVDGYDGDKELAKQGEVRLAFCWSV